MDLIMEQQLLQWLWEALNTSPRQKLSHRAHYLFTKFSRDSWAYRSDLEDVIGYLDPRLDMNVKTFRKLIAAFNFKWEMVCARPKVTSNEVTQFEAIRSEEAAHFLIYLEQLGFEVDPLPLIRILLPKIKVKEKKILSAAELAIFWYERFRHKTAPMRLIIEDQQPLETSSQIRTAKGYIVQAEIDSNGQVIFLKVAAPKFRSAKAPVLVTCDACGLDWYRGDPDSSAQHRKIHPKRMSYLDPKPHIKLVAMGGIDSAIVYVDESVPLWMHKEMFARAAAFKYEMRYDRSQWEDPSSGRETSGIGALLLDEKKAIVGAVCFRDFSSLDEEKFWGLDWIWICPSRRRLGYLQQQWKELKLKFGEFFVSSPVSDAMMKFLTKQGDLELIKSPRLRK